jgi:hypothetical protein
MARMEKQRDKAAKRVERKLAKEAGVTEPDDLDIELDEFGVPRERADAMDQAGSAGEAGSADRPDKVEPKE